MILVLFYVEMCLQVFFILFLLLFFESTAVNGRWFSPGTPASSTSKTGGHDIAESGVKHQNQIKSNLRLLITPLVSSNCSHEYVSIVILFIIFVYERSYDRSSDFDCVTYSYTCYEWGNGDCKHWHVYLSLLFPYELCSGVVQTYTWSKHCHIQESNPNFSDVRH